MTSELIAPISRDLFISTPRGAEDKFAGTFLAKADALDLWPLAQGIRDENGTVAAAIVVRYSKRTPTVANLQLLHTFARHRRRGLAKALVLAAYSAAQAFPAAYWRVSSEPDAAPFYRSLGFRFWGEQKSGCLLSISRIRTEKIEWAEYDRFDPVISKALTSKQRGALVRHLDAPV